MIDDDLRELISFRDEVAAPDEATTRRVYARVTQHPDRLRSHSFPEKRRFSRRLAIALAAAAVAVVPPAVAFGGKLANLFQGTPPTPAVSTAYQTLNRVADKATRQGFAAKFPTADLGQLHGVIEITTSDGPEDLGPHRTIKAANAGSLTSQMTRPPRAASSATAPATPPRRPQHASSSTHSGSDPIRRC
jgi:hypothetical protein